MDFSLLSSAVTSMAQIAAGHGLAGQDCLLVDDDEENLSDAQV